MYSKEATGKWRAEPLPRGRHKLDRSQVRASQRERLLRAMLTRVATDGWAATTVPRVASAARVSPNTFYAHFTDKADCFLAACDDEVSELMELLVEAGTDVTNGVRIYLDWWRERPQTSRAYLLELPAAGERAQQQRREVHERFAQMFEALAPGPVSPIAVRVLVAGLTELVAAEVAAGRLEELDGLAGEVERVIVRALSVE